MPSLLKILLPLVAVGAVATITFIAVPSGTTLVSLKDVADYKYPATTTNAKFGALFSHFFLSTTHKENDAEWEARAKEIKTTSTVSDTFFSGLTSSVTAKQLKNKCKEAYNKTDFNKSESKTNTKWGEVWERCSIGKKAPVVLEEIQTGEEKTKTDSSGSWNGKLGATKKADLLSITHTNNQWIWDVLNKEFGTGYLAPDTTNSQNKDFKKTELLKTVKSLCEDAYGNKDTETSNKALKYCSLKRAQTN